MVIDVPSGRVTARVRCAAGAVEQVAFAGVPARVTARGVDAGKVKADVAWGDGDDQNNGQPVLLDDVPDVSAKYQSAASALGAEVRLDMDDLVDDMPTPAPYRSSALARPSDPVDNATVPMLPAPVPILHLVIPHSGDTHDERPSESGDRRGPRP